MLNSSQDKMKSRVLMFVFILHLSVSTVRVSSGKLKRKPATTTHHSITTDTSADNSHVAGTGMIGSIAERKENSTVLNSRSGNSSSNPNIGLNNATSAASVISKTTSDSAHLRKDTAATTKRPKTSKLKQRNPKRRTTVKMVDKVDQQDSVDKVLVNNSSNLSGHSSTQKTKTSSSLAAEKLSTIHNKSGHTTAPNTGENARNPTQEAEGSATVEELPEDADQQQDMNVNIEVTSKRPDIASTPQRVSSTSTSKPAGKPTSKPIMNVAEDILDPEASEGNPIEPTSEMLDDQKPLSRPVVHDEENSEEAAPPLSPNQKESPTDSEEQDEDGHDSPADTSQRKYQDDPDHMVQASYDSNGEDNSWLPGSSSFMAYFLIGSAVVFLAYFAYHYRSRIAGRCFACLVEGRRRGRSTGARQRQRSSNNRHHSGSGSESVTVEYKPLRTADKD